MASFDDDNEKEAVPFGDAELALFGDFWLMRHFSGTKGGFTGIRDSQLGENDVLVATFPKSGM